MTQWGSIFSGSMGTTTSLYQSLYSFNTIKAERVDSNKSLLNEKENKGNIFSLLYKNLSLECCWRFIRVQQQISYGQLAVILHIVS